MINQSNIDPSYLDKIHSKVKVVESNLKGFKLKSRTAYEELVDQETGLSYELGLLAEKFSQYELEKSESSQRKETSVKKGNRSSSVNARLLKPTKSVQRKQFFDIEEDPQS